LRDLLEARYGPDGEGLVRELHGLTRSRNHRVRLEATRLLAAYFFGPPQQHVAVDVTASTTRPMTPEMLALCTTEELRVLYAIAQRFGPEDESTNRLLPPDGREDAEAASPPPRNPGCGPT
jgi:hypothetical protein